MHIIHVMENVKSQVAWDNRGKMSTELRNLLKPSLIAMAISGCCTYIPDTVRSKQANMTGPCGVFWTIYRAFFFITCLAACAKTAAAFPYLPASFIQLNVVKMLWFTQCLVVFLVSLKATYSKSGSQKVAFDFWDDKIRPEFEDLGIKLSIEKIQRRQTIHVVLAMLLTVVNTSCNIMMSTGLVVDGFDIFLYQILRNTMGILIVVLFGFWMIVPLVLLALVSIAAAIVHDAVSLSVRI